MNVEITYGVQRNIAAKDRDGKDAKIALAVIRMPDGVCKYLGIPEALLATIPNHQIDDFIASEIESVIGYEVTRAA